jgi:hypothetical protein
LRDGKANLHETREEVDFNIRNINAKNLGDNPTGLEDSVGLRNTSVELALEILQKSIFGEIEAGREGADLTKIGLGDVTEYFTTMGVDVGSALEGIEFSSDASLVLNININKERCMSLSAGSGEVSSRESLSKFARELHSLSRSIFSENLWDEDTNVVSGNCKIQIFFKEISDIEGVSSLPSGVKGGVYNIIS